MTLYELITKYTGIINRQSAKELKANEVFMRACRENPEFRAYVLDRKPTMASVRVSPVKFKKKSNPLPPETVKYTDAPPVMCDEEDEEVSKAVQFYRDVVKHGEKNGFLF